MKMPHGKIIRIQVEYFNTIKDVKVKIRQKEGIALKYQSILLNGKLLEDGCMLNDYDIIQKYLILQLALSKYTIVNYYQKRMSVHIELSKMK